MGNLSPALESSMTRVLFVMVFFLYRKVAAPDILVR